MGGIVICWASFHLALFVCSFLIGNLISGPLAALLPGGLVTQDNFLALHLMITTLCMAAYSIAKGTHRLQFWSTDALTPASWRFATGHLGIVVMAIAIFVMVNAGSASGVVLVPPLIWTIVFYRKGFAEIALACDTPPAATPPPASASFPAWLLVLMIVALAIMVIASMLQT